MHGRHILSLGMILFTFFVMMNAPRNLWQSNLNNNDREEPINHILKTPTVAYQPPLLIDPNTDFQFNTSERCERNLGWSNWSTSDISFETPPFYNWSYANMTFRVRNATTETWATVGSKDTTEKKINFAQGFIITQNATMSGFSICVTGSGITVIPLSIREETPGGPILYSFPVTIPNLVDGSWFNVTLNSSVSLAAGHYYLYYPNLGASINCRWYHTGTGAFGDAYANGVEANYNMTLKVHTKNFVDPESVSMNVSNQPVQNLGNGTGWANLTSIITGNTKTFSVSNSSPIECAYSSYIMCSRTSKSVNAVNLTTGDANWTLTAFSYPGLNYSVYQANITGFNENHTFIQGFLGQNTVGFSRPPPYTTLIFETAVDRITFLSTNYVLSGEIPPEVHSNQDIELNVTVGDIGNICVNVYSDTGSVYTNKTYASGTNSFRWHVETALAAGEYTFEATFFNPNNMGFFRQNITLVKVATIVTYNLSIQTLDVMRLNFRLFDLYGGSYIPDATLNYYFTDLRGSLQYDSLITHNYTKDINLETFSIHPGKYDLLLEATKLGYQSILVSTPVEIMKRAMDFGVSRSATNLVPGSTLEVGVTPRDGLTGGNLLRPVNITINIYPAGGNPDADAVANETIYSTTTLETQLLVIPVTAALGAYDILIRIQSDFYSGSQLLHNGLIVDAPPNWLLYILVVAGVAVAATGAYVQRQKLGSKRSVRGAIIMNPGGMPIAQRISADFSTMNAHLISGAVMGIVTMVKEMTGSKIRTIALEGCYLKIVFRDTFWFILLTQRNPGWISGTIKKCISDIELRYGAKIAEWRGEGNIQISLDLTLKRWFGVDITETRDPHLELAGGANPDNHETGDPNPPAPPAPPVNP